MDTIMFLGTLVHFAYKYITLDTERVNQVSTAGL